MKNPFSHCLKPRARARGIPDSVLQSDASASAVPPPPPPPPPPAGYPTITSGGSSSYNYQPPTAYPYAAQQSQDHTTSSNAYNKSPSRAAARAARAARAAARAARAASNDSDEDDVSDSEQEITFWKNYKPQTTYVLSGWNHNVSGIQIVGETAAGNSHYSSREEKLQIADSGYSGYRLYCKRQEGNRDLCVTARSGKLFLTLPDKYDSFQFWHKVEYNNTFMIVNDATNKAVKYTNGFGDQLCLVNKPMYPEKFLLWTESEDVLCTGHRYLWAQSQPAMVMDASNGTKTGNIFDGTKISLFFRSRNCRGNHTSMPWDSQLWKFIPC